MKSADHSSGARFAARPHFSGKFDGDLNLARGRAVASPSAILGVGSAILLVGVLAYQNSFFGPFVYDDIPAITENASIRSLGSALFPPRGVTVTGRPLANLSFALNYATSGSSVWSYHALNLVIHLLAALALFGIVRRTLRLNFFCASFGSASLALGGLVASLWMVHPLQTEAVTYTVQRTESLMGLFYLLAFYGFVRALDSVAPVRWYVLSVGACVLGMISKEVMVSAPLLIFLYDRTLVSGSFRAAWRNRRNYYLSLGCTWIFLGYSLLVTGGNRDGSKGFGTGVAWADYFLTQFKAVVTYLALSFWPHPLAFDYPTFWASRPSNVLPFAAVVVPLLLATLLALWRRSVWGIFGVWFFAILAPTSLVPGATQMIVEHRMYLSLAAVIAALTLGFYRIAGVAAIWVSLLAVGAFGWNTHLRNSDYATELRLWNSTVVSQPTNAIAQSNLGVALVQSGRVDEGVMHYRTALKLEPAYARVHYNLAIALTKLGSTSEAIEQYQIVERLLPTFAQAYANLGVLEFQKGNGLAAVAQYQRALQLQPQDSEVEGNLANALFQTGQSAQAIAHYQESLKLNPQSAPAHYNFGNSLFRLGRYEEAALHFRTALLFQPDDADTSYNLALTLVRLGKKEAAIAAFERVLQLLPDDPRARRELARLRAANE